LICDIDHTLLGDRDGLAALLARLREARPRLAFGIASGRRLASAVEVLEEWGMPPPEVWVTAVGSEIRYGPGLVEDADWTRHIDDHWEPERLRRVLAQVPGLDPQARTEQRRFKLSYFLDPEVAPPLAEIRHLLRQEQLYANLVYSHDTLLDVLPLRASKGYAVRYLAARFGLDLGRVLVAGDSGNDAEMLCGMTQGVVVGNYSPELEALRGRPRIYFAQGHHAWGIVEGIDHYRFLGRPESTPWVARARAEMPA
jgi:sucrose-phosphate synthase